MEREVIEMSHAEVDRLELIGMVSARRLLQREAAVRSGLSVRRVKRLVSRYRELGASGLVSGHGGKVPNHAFAAAFRQSVLELVKEQHADSGPTLAGEKLWEREGCRVSSETLRQWMIEADLWRPRRRRAARIHPRRERRARLGELVQVDGSPHDWFEGRSGRCTLIVFIDDATSRLQALRFVSAETTEACIGSVTLLGNGRELACRVLREGEAPAPIADEKSVQAAVERARAKQARRPTWKPPADHPWRRPIIQSPSS